MSNNQQLPGIEPPPLVMDSSPMQSVNQLSLLTGLDRATVTRRLKYLDPVPGPKNAQLYDTTKALPAIYRIGDADSDRLDPQQEKALLDREKRRIEELKRQEMEGRLVDIATVRDDWLAILGIASNRLLALPSHLAPDLTGLDDMRQVEDLLRAAIHDVLEEMSGDVRSGATA